MKIVMLTEDSKIEFTKAVLNGIKKQGDYPLHVVISDRNKKVAKMFIDKDCDVLHIIKVPKYEKSKQVTSFEIGGSVGWDTQNRLEVAYLRNYALDLDDEIFFVDSDVVLPDNAINTLKKVQGDVILGWYFCRSNSTIAIVGKNFDTVLEEIKQGDPFKIIGGGIGCALFRNVKERFDLYDDYVEDLPLLKKLENVICVPSIYCEHLGYFKPKALEFKEKIIKQWKL